MFVPVRLCVYAMSATTGPTKAVASFAVARESQTRNSFLKISPIFFGITSIWMKDFDDTEHFSIPKSIEPTEDDDYISFLLL